MPVEPRTFEMYTEIFEIPFEMQNVGFLVLTSSLWKKLVGIQLTVMWEP